MNVAAPALDRLRSEYLEIGEHLALMARLKVADDPNVLRLQAREMEIVDEIRSCGLAPDVLVKGVAPA